jgi:3-phenylpropionate/cinnamic acid dioxygenase small subunit
MQKDIENVIIRYAWAYDEDRFDEMAALFTPDATFDVSEPSISTIHGVDAIVAFQRTAREGRAARGERPRHLVNNVWIIESDDTAATAISYMTLAVTYADGSAGIALTGTYDDRFLRTATGWKIAARRLEFDRHRG